MEMISSLKKYIKNMNGKVIGIGIENEKIIEEIDKNNKILECDLLNSVDIKSNATGKNKRKKYIKKLRKQYKKKTIDYMVINSNEADKYLKKIVKDSIYINNGDIYYYLDKNYEQDRIIKKYKRYNTEIEIKKYNDGFIIKIDTRNAKNNFFKDMIYYVIDTLSNVADLIGDILVS